MSTKEQMLNTIIDIEAQNRRLAMKIEGLEAANKSLTLAVQTSLPELEIAKEDSHSYIRNMVWRRNQKPKDAARAQFVALKEWAGRNVGYGDNEEEKQATGLGGLVYLRDCEVSFALRFAAEVCEQHNWHQEAAKLMYMYEREITPYEDRQPVEKQTVNWWAE